MRKKKSLGQHFLSNKNILTNMINAANVGKKDIVLEVGPGEGSLTEILAKHAKKVVAVEKDSDLIPFLHDKFKKYNNLNIIHGDILTINPSLGDRVAKSYKVVANIPYYITARFLRKFLEAKNKPSVMVLMVQKEVAERIVAKNKKNSLLSLSVNAYGKTEILRIVPRGAFSPPPEVDSAIIKISDISDGFFKKNKLNEKTFFEILRGAFQQKRKMLRQSIGKKIKLPDAYKTKRPEELNLSDWSVLLHN